MLIINTQVLEVLAALPDGQKLLRLVVEDLAFYPVLQNIGKQWLQKQQTPVLKVPSTIIPVEFNYLLNPQHPDLQLSLLPPLWFRFAQRMWKAQPS